VLWLDESGISSTAELGTTRAITGNTAVLAENNQRFRVDLIADQHPAHKAKTVAPWLAENDQRIVQHFLPGYDPELNPVEVLNGDTEREVANKAAPRNRLAMAAAIRAHPHRLQQSPDRVISFVHKPEIAYAAA
jgi:transposase